MEGGRPILAFPRRAAGGRWVTHGLQGSDPLDPCPNSISARTISLPLSDIISKTEQDSYLLPKLENNSHHTHTSCSPFVWIVLPQLVPVCMHRFQNWCFEELMLKTGTCCYEVGATAVQALLFSCIVTDRVDTNYPYFQSTNWATTYKAEVKPSPFMQGIFWCGCRPLWDFSTKHRSVVQGGGNVEGGELRTMGLLRKATKSQRLTSKGPLVSKPVLWLELDTLFPWV